MSVRRIFFVNRVYWPNEAATAQLLTDLAEALGARGWEVHVIASGDHGVTLHRGVTIHRTGGSAEHRGLWSRALNYLRFLRAARRILTQQLHGGEIVVLKTDPPLLAAVATGVASRHGAHVVHWIQDIYPEIVVRHAGEWFAPLLQPLQWLRNRAWRRARYCVVPSADMREPLLRAGLPPTRLNVFPNWAPRELQEPATAEEVAAVRAAWNASGKFVVAYSGNLGRVHEFDTILGAAAQLRGESVIQFAFVGHGPRLAEVSLAVAKARLTNVQFYSFQPREKLGASLAAADVHLVSLRPGFDSLVNPSKLSGILAAGRPALFVGPPESAMATLLRTRACGLSFSNGDSDGLARAIRALQADTARVRDLGKAARAVYDEALTLEVNVNAWDTMLQRLTKSESTLP